MENAVGPQGLTAFFMCAVGTETVYKETAVFARITMHRDPPWQDQD